MSELVLLAFRAMKHAVPHDLEPEIAKKVTEKAWDAYRARFEQYNPTISWGSDTKANVGFSAKGLTVSGTLELKPQAIEMDLEVPFLLRPFRKKAVEVIEREIRNWIGKAKAGEL